ncbi:MAG: hypothetical protein ACC682_13560 [Gemmatimonadota bacterium]
MSKEAREPNESEVGEMRAEYDFSDAERSRYADRFKDGSNVVVLDPDVAAVFPDSKAVNDALRKAAGLD